MSRLSTSERFGLERVRVRGFRSALDVTLEPGRLCALVGEANAGKSNLLLAIRALLDPAAPALSAEDVSAGADGEIAIEGWLSGAGARSLAARPPGAPRLSGQQAPPVAFLAGELRTGDLLAPAVADAGAARPDQARTERARTDQARADTDARGDQRASPLAQFRRALATHRGAHGDGSAASPAASLVAAVEACCESGVRGLVLLIEEPELYLRPQAQRYLYRLLRRLADAGNQVIYSTHAPSFLNVARLEELALVRRERLAGTTIMHPRPITPDEAFRVLSEFDAERSELFLARAVVLVEGQTEKLAFPFVFAALGHDSDREGISIVACGGKSNIPLFARVCRAVRVPFIAVYDRDAPPGRRPTRAARSLNALIAQLAGPEHTVMLEPDFEGATGLRAHRHKPEQAWRSLRLLPPERIPRPLLDAVERVLGLAREE
jgi:AAA ATPase domain